MFRTWPIGDSLKSHFGRRGFASAVG